MTGALTFGDAEAAGTIILAIIGLIAVIALAALAAWILSCAADAIRGHGTPPPGEIGDDINPDGTTGDVDQEIERMIRDYGKGGHGA